MQPRQRPSVSFDEAMCRQHERKLSSVGADLVLQGMHVEATSAGTRIKPALDLELHILCAARIFMMIPAKIFYCMRWRA